jgi:cytochrome b561
MDTKEQLSKISLSLHWIVAFGMIGLIAVGFYMTNTETWGLYSIHKSLGVILFIFVFLRVLWRIKNGWPIALQTYPRHEQILAKTIHWVLILATLAMPLSGMLYSGASGHGFGVFGWVLVPLNPDPDQAGQVIALNAALADIGHEIHEVLGYLVSLAIVLHVAGALKHHLKNKDRTLLRMLGK